jgi:hypothetical protein
MTKRSSQRAGGGQYLERAAADERELGRAVSDLPALEILQT